MNGRMWGMLVCVAMMVPVAAAGQNVDAFRSDLREIDPEGSVIIRVEAEQTLAWVYLEDGWYYLQCFQKERLADNIRGLWRRHGGSNVVLKDKAGKTIADFKIIGSGWKIPGCDTEQR